MVPTTYVMFVDLTCSQVVYSALLLPLSAVTSVLRDDAYFLNLPYHKPLGSAGLHVRLTSIGFAIGRLHGY